MIITRAAATARNDTSHMLSVKLGLPISIRELFANSEVFFTTEICAFSLVGSRFMCCHWSWCTSADNFSRLSCWAAPYLCCARNKSVLRHHNEDLNKWQSVYLTLSVWVIFQRYADSNSIFTSALFFTLPVRHISEGNAVIGSKMIKL